MQRYLGLICGLCYAMTAQAADLDGTYVLKARDGQLVTRMQVNGQTLRGVIEVPNGTPIRLLGTAQASRARGTATSAHGNGQFHAELVGNKLVLVISQDAGPNQEAMELPLQFYRSQ